MMLVNMASCTSFLFPLHILIQLRLSNWYTQMYGAPAPQLSCEGYQYYISFMDDFSRYLWIFPLQQKSDAVTVFLQFNKMVATQFCASIKCLQTDWGGEYRKFQSLLHDLGIGFMHPCPHTHQQNGKIERKHQSSRNRPYLACKRINGYQILVGGHCFSCLPSE